MVTINNGISIDYIGYIGYTGYIDCIMPRLEDMDYGGGSAAPPPPSLRSQISSGIAPPSLRSTRSQVPSLSLNLSDVKFQGRRVELKFIRAIYKETIKGDCAKGVLLFGDSGCGKTSLVLSFREYFMKSIKCGSFLSTKIHESRNPFASFKIAICQLCDQMIRQKRQDEIDLLRATLDDEDLLILHKFDSRFQKIFQLKNRNNFGAYNNNNSSKNDRDRLPIKLQKILRNAIQICASPEFPVVLFVDDMHQVDKDSANIIRSLLFNSSPGFLFIGCHRHDSCSKDRIQIIESLDNCVSHRIDGLGERDVNDIIASLLSRDAVETEDLSAVIWKKTGA